MDTYGKTSHGYRQIYTKLMSIAKVRGEKLKVLRESPVRWDTNGKNWHGNRQLYKYLSDRILLARTACHKGRAKNSTKLISSPRSKGLKKS